MKSIHLKPHFHIEKLGFAGVYLIILFYPKRSLWVLVRVSAIRKMVIGGRRVAKIPFIPSGRGPHWKLENRCLVNFKSCKSVEINGCIPQRMTF